MRSSNIPYVPAVDHLRGLAAVWIAVFHTFHTVGPEVFVRVPPQGQAALSLPDSTNPFILLIREGDFAVALFMVLSGFIFTYGAYGRQIVYHQFIRNRILRIYPLLGTLLLLSVVFIILGRKEHVPLSSVLLSVFPVTLEYQGVRTPFSAMFWTLAIECQFYVVFPLIFMLAVKGGPYKVLPFMVGCFVGVRLVAAMLGSDVYHVAYFTILGRIDEFLIGMLAGFLYAEKRIPLPLLKRLFPVIGLLTWYLLYQYAILGGYTNRTWWNVLKPPTEALVWAVFVLSYLEFSTIVPLLMSRGLEWLGTVSYSLYMLHISVIWLVTKADCFMMTGWGVYSDLLINFVVELLPLLLLVSSLSYYAIERPFLNLRRRYVGTESRVAELTAQKLAVR